MNSHPSQDPKVAAIVLAAGLSLRMGQPKMILPWGHTTVIGRVVEVMGSIGLSEVLVVTGGARESVESVLNELPLQISPRLVFNSDFENGEMLRSIQVGLEALDPTVEAAIIALGDQPQIQVEVARGVLHTYLQERAPIVAPSYRMRRGHPWLLRRDLWSEVLRLRPPSTLKTFIDQHPKEIRYYEVDQASILQDLDTPEDYREQKPT